MWTGDLSQLKVLVKDELNVTGQWSSPGGDVNRFWGESVSIKWNQDNKELKILGKNKQAIEQRLDIGSGNLLIPQLTNVEGTDNDYGCPETRNKTSHKVFKSKLVSLENLVFRLTRNNQKNNDRGPATNSINTPSVTIPISSVKLHNLI